MKKLVFAAVTMMVLAGSTFAVPMFSTPAAPAVAATVKGGAKPASIPPPSCPVNDPNGCGIFG
jgi:hypothetical protein